ncbi:leucine/isoleucine/valine transporter subunit; ATP-binding component of ABC superfamily [Candidatus Desulfarcum epimagneticum]|uniref:Leucine/isoleucine/valine transporter subunit ATP-binding component of ABC superfamily n=1 Tax=uncultured Desulfobacteraceae bacterium TaxID=218296 RepID=A0A484HN16_9BACT|nr:leucine/isoleucine/valine transporter subunit; ATP-binding component of ABC superfamily [uncultured Desulfobacteraceae bacterium]
MNTQNPLLELKDIHTFYGHIHALKGVSLSIHDGEIMCLIGANGAGKSTTLMTISGVEKAARGRIFFDSNPIEEMEPEKIAALGVSQAPEGRQIFPRMTVFENLEMGAYLRKDRDKIKEDMEWVFSLFPVLKDRTGQLGGTLSGGEQQMLAIARALMSRPRLLLLDEPSLGLAPRLVETIFETIMEINRAGAAIFLVEQNARMALAVSDSGCVMETGSIVLADRASRLLENEKVRQAYLGES